MEVAKDWPVMTSYDDLSKYAQVKGGRLPTEAELRLFLDNFAIGYEGGANIGFRNWHPVPYVSNFWESTLHFSLSAARRLASRERMAEVTMGAYGNGLRPFLNPMKAS